MAEKRSIDWEAIERDYRAGIKTLRQIADEHDVTHGAINKRAKKGKWERDLSNRIAAKVESLVSKRQVSSEVSKEQLDTEEQIVERNADSIADKVLSQRKDVTRARGVVTSLFEELEGQLGDTVHDLNRLGELMASPDDKGMDKLNDLYHKIISLPGRTDTAKKLSESLRILIELERKVLRIKDDPEVAATVVMKADPNLSPADAYLRMLGKK